MKKIMFNDRFGLTQAVLSGRKTMTRRIIPRDFFTLQWDEKGDTLWCEDDMGDFIDVRKTRYAQYKVGDVVAIAQSYKDAGYNKGYYRDEDSLIFIYKSNTPEKDIPVSPISWSNKMFTRADLMPHHIRITDIKVERLQDISDADCLCEGIRQSVIEYEGKKIVQYTYFGEKRTIWYDSPREAFATLIDRISGKGTWESNLLVFAYKFELVD